MMTDEELAQDLEWDAEFYEGFTGDFYDGIAEGLRKAAKRVRERETA